MKNEIHIKMRLRITKSSPRAAETAVRGDNHVQMVQFGLCKKGMPCMPVTPVAWVDVNKKHIIEGAPALTEESKLACFHGGVITIVPLDAGSAEEGDKNENAEDSVESIAAEALAFAGSLAGKGKGKIVKNLVKQKEVKLSKAKILEENRKKGREFELESLERMKESHDDVVEQITVITESGTKTRLDGIGIDKNTGEIVIEEYKSSPTAPLTQNQEAAFPEITESGATVVGKGKKPFVGGTEIPPTKIEIKRKK